MSEQRNPADHNLFKRAIALPWEVKPRQVIEGSGDTQGKRNVAQTRPVLEGEWSAKRICPSVARGAYRAKL
jgi:hypothetical protein